MLAALLCSILSRLGKQGWLALAFRRLRDVRRARLPYALSMLVNLSDQFGMQFKYDTLASLQIYWRPTRSAHRRELPCASSTRGAGLPQPCHTFPAPAFTLVSAAIERTVAPDDSQALVKDGRMEQTTDLDARRANRTVAELMGSTDEVENVPTDEETRLIRAAQADITAFDALYDRYLPRVYRYARAHSADAHDATDLTQLVFLRALEALPRYQPRGVPFAVWLFRIARHAVIDAHRRQRPSVSWETLPEAQSPVASESLDQALIRQEEQGRLRDAISRLTGEQRELLALSVAAGLSAPEIALALGIRPDAVRKRLSRVIANLKERYHAS